jgi:hypothetical protein
VSALISFLNPSYANSLQRVQDICIAIKNLVLHQPDIQLEFCRLEGYSLVFDAICATTPSSLVNYLRRIDNSVSNGAIGATSSGSSLESDLEHLTIGVDAIDCTSDGLCHAMFLISLIYDEDITMDFLTNISDNGYNGHNALQVSNINALLITIKLIQSSLPHISMLGIFILESIVRINYSSIVAVKECKGLSTIGELIMSACIYGKLNHKIENSMESQSCSADFIYVCKRANLFLLRSSVLLSDVNCSSAAFFVALLLQFGKRIQVNSTKIRSPNESKRRSSISTLNKCSNCESETAIFECTHFRFVL